MSQPSSKLNHRLHEEATTRQRVEQSNAVMEFANAEEMLRADAAHTAVPDTLAERLQESVNQEPRPSRRWWQRMFKSSAN